MSSLLNALRSLAGMTKVRGEEPDRELVIGYFPRSSLTFTEKELSDHLDMIDALKDENLKLREKIAELERK